MSREMNREDPMAAFSRRCGAVFAFLFFAAAPGAIRGAVNPHQYRARASRISQAVKIDGRLDEPVWAEAAGAGGFVQREPDEGKPATEGTEVRILYDDENIYFGVRCRDREAGRIVANEMRRDAELESNDYIEIILDTYHDSRNAFYFATNALGAQRDALIRDEGASLNVDWDGIWVCRTSRDRDGWTAEIAIPFYTLRFGPEPRPVWGMNIGRKIARKKEEDYWVPVLRDYGFLGKYRISYFGHLDGLEDIRQGKSLQLMPYLIGGASQSGRGEPLTVSANAGLDLKTRLASNITADLTVNTDFAQVESDQEQFNLTRFDLFYPEKREFFLEGADIFRFGERFQEHDPPSTLLFFSRTIGLTDDGRTVPLLGGVKVTGKAGRTDIGVLDIMTDRLSYLDDDENRVNLARTNFSVVRLKRDIFEKSSIGVIGLSKDPLSSGADFNRAAGFDFNLAFGSNFQSAGFLAKTFSPGRSGGDWAGHLNALWTSDLLSADLSYTDIGTDFDAEMGFVPRTDIRKLRANVAVAPRPDILGLRQVYAMDNFTYIENHAGVLQSRSHMAGAFNMFQNGTELFLGYMSNYELLTEPFEIESGVFIPIGVHKYDMFVGMFNSNRSRNLSLEAEMDMGGFYNGRLTGWRAQGNVKASKNFSLEFIYNRNAFNLPVPGGRFEANIGAARLIYSFSPDLYGKAFIQWNDTDEMFKSNVLVRWIYKPGANLYFIYNESRRLGAAGYIKDRMVMLKISFLFNY
jgi:hypothetical protein